MNGGRRRCRPKNNWIGNIIESQGLGIIDTALMMTTDRRMRTDIVRESHAERWPPSGIVEVSTELSDHTDTHVTCERWRRRRICLRESIAEPLALVGTLHQSSDEGCRPKNNWIGNIIESQGLGIIDTALMMTTDRRMRTDIVREIHAERWPPSGIVEVSTELSDHTDTHVTCERWRRRRICLRGKHCRAPGPRGHPSPVQRCQRHSGKQAPYCDRKQAPYCDRKQAPYCDRKQAPYCDRKQAPYCDRKQAPYCDRN